MQLFNRGFGRCQLQSLRPLLHVVLETLRFVQADLDPAEELLPIEIVHLVLNGVLSRLLGVLVLLGRRGATA